MSAIALYNTLVIGSLVTIIIIMMLVLYDMTKKVS